jgi:hypothetical protein
MARNYRDEYARRVARGVARGKTRQEARGHGQTPEHPEQVFRRPERFPVYRARLNQRRMKEGKPPLLIGEQPAPLAPGQRREEVDTLEEAERATQGIPLNYVRIYATSRGTWIYEIDRRESRYRRRAA